MKYDAAVFDLDGTLLDTLEDLTDSVNCIMCRYGYQKKTMEQVCAYVGNGSARLIELCLPEGAQTEGFQRIVGEYREHYLANCAVKTKPYEGITETLRALKDGGVKMAVVSNKPDSAAKSLCKLFFGDYIDICLGEAEEDERKPSPKQVLAAVSQMGVSKERAVYAGDSEVDILTAKNAGMDCLSVSWGFRSAERLAECGAETIIGCPRRILDYI